MLLLLLPLYSRALPSCESETEANCLGDDADMSPEGINACLTAVSEKSADCTTYLAMMDACGPVELSDGGVCHAAKMDGEAVPCLVQRVKPEELSEACAAALPKSELKGLAKFWADGKRQLNINEIADLNKDDKDTYNRWQKRKKGTKTDKDKERDYAVKAAKKERAEQLIKEAVKAAKPASSEAALEAAQAAEKTLLAEDMTGTLKPLTKPQLHGLATEAYKTYRKEKAEL